MTTVVDGLSWKAIMALLGGAALCVSAILWMDGKTHARIDEVRADIAEMKADIGDLKINMAVVIALLERVERGQSAGSIPAKPSARPAKPGSPGQPEARRGHRPIGNPANDTASK